MAWKPAKIRSKSTDGLGTPSKKPTGGFANSPNLSSDTLGRAEKILRLTLT